MLYVLEEKYKIPEKKKKLAINMIEEYKNID